MSADTLMSELSALPREAPAAVPCPGPSAGRVALGQAWNGAYDVTALVDEPGGGWYRATERATGREVWLRVRAAKERTADGAAVFEKLRTIACPHLQRPIAEHVTADEEVQIWEPARGVCLRRWRADQSEPGLAPTVELVRQMTAAVMALHAVGLGHFGLHPDRVFVEETAEGPRFVLGGGEGVTAVDQSELIMIEVDPLYAPPETAGLFKHSPGAGLLAWDWWSLGRVVQSWMLGRHVVTMLPDELKAELPRGLVGLGEALLFERATGTLRAGAVELMGAIDPRADRLLRGLLTSSVDGRWGAEGVQAWLQGEMPAEHYRSGRHERFFQLDGRSFSPKEAAERLLDAEHGAVMEDHALAAEKPGMLANFLAETDGAAPERATLESVSALEKSTALSRLNPKLRRLIVATLGLHALAQGPFRWRGQVVNAENLRVAWGKPAGGATLRAELVALAEPAVVAQVRRHDPGAADLLESLVKSVVEAEQFFGKQIGLRPAELGQPARLWLLALAGEAVLAATRREMQTRYARSTEAAVEKLWRMPHPTAVMLLVLARMEDEPARFGFLTHEDVRRGEQEARLEQGAVLGEIIFWRRLGTAMAAGPMVFGRRWACAAAGAGGLLLLAVHVPGPMGLMWGLVPLALALALRGLANRHQAGMVARWIRGAAPWRWRDGGARCAAEAGKLGAATGQPTALAAALREWEVVRQAVAAAAPDPTPLVQPPRPLATWAAVTAAWGLTLLLVVGSAWQGYRRPPSWTAHLAAWQEAIDRSRAPTAEELRNVKLSWPYRPSLIEAPFEVKVQAEFHPTPEQLTEAAGRARQQLERYDPQTINALTAVYLPIADQKGALMLFDGRKNALQGTTGVLIDYVPLAKTWIQIGEKRAVFIEK